MSINSECVGKSMRFEVPPRKRDFPNVPEFHSIKHTNVAILLRSCGSGRTSNGED